MRGDHHAVVGDVQQPVDRFDHDPLSDQVSAHVVAVSQDADPPRSVDPARDRWPLRSWLPLGLDLRVDHLDLDLLHELEAPGGWHVPDRLVLALAVIAGDPGIELGLSRLERGEGPVGQELTAQALVEPLDLAGGGR